MDWPGFALKGKYFNFHYPIILMILLAEKTVMYFIFELVK